jgi:hypothetical protein
VSKDQSSRIRRERERWASTTMRHGVGLAGIGISRWRCGHTALLREDIRLCPKKLAGLHAVLRAGFVK